MLSKRSSYSGRRRIESASTTKRRRERATQKAKQDDQVVEITNENVSDTQQTAITETEERGCVWWFSRCCAIIPFTAMLALVVYIVWASNSDDPFNQIWRNWRFIVPFVVFSSVAFLGLRDDSLEFLIVFPLTVVVALCVYLVWLSVDGDFDSSNFWRDWRFIVVLVLFNSQAFLGLKEGIDSCLLKMLGFCVALTIIAWPAFLVYFLFLFIIYGDSFEFRWDRYFTIFLVFVYYLTFLGTFGFLEKWITYLDRKLKKRKNKKR